MPPDILDEMITEEIEAYIYWENWNAMKAREDEAKKRLKELSENWTDKPINYLMDE